MSEKPYDLAANRTIRLNVGAAKHSITVRPATEAEWFAYFDSIVVTSEQSEDGVVRSSDAGGAAIALVSKLIVSAEGYPANEIPIQHLLAVAEALLKVEAVDNDELVLEYAPQGQVVVLKAGKHDPLVHIFRAPTIEQYKRYMRASSRALIVGGSRKGKTVFVGAQRELAALWDELIVLTHGYLFQNATMDTRHKVVAMEKLLSVPVVETEED